VDGSLRYLTLTRVKKAAIMIKRVIKSNTSIGLVVS
jgi:hypothetical protein